MAGNNPQVRILCRAIKNGCFKEWTAAELKIWLVLKAHQNSKDKKVWPSYSTLQNCTGLNAAGVHRGLQRLVRRKELRVLAQGTPTESTKYEMVD